MKKKTLLFLSLLLAVSLPALAVFSGMDLNATLRNLRFELQRDFQKISVTQEKLSGRYLQQHQKMVEIIKQCDELSLMLYSQKQDYTFDLSYALEKVTAEYNDFNEDRLPYDRIVNTLDIEINRYARLIESLRRLPPELKELGFIPDSLEYHNDSLDLHLSQNESVLLSALDSTFSHAPFLLDEAGQEDRDSCLLYASELLKLYAGTKLVVVSDSTHYREAYLRLKESYDYARDYYKLLQKNIFIEGQTPWGVILAHPGMYWKQAVEATSEKYTIADIGAIIQDDGTAAADPQDNRYVYTSTLRNVLGSLLLFLLVWGVSALVFLLIFRFVKSMREAFSKEQRPYIIMIFTCLLFLGLSRRNIPDELVEKAVRLFNTFIWLLMAIVTALLLRLKPAQLKGCFKHYMPTIFTALFVISCRVLFLPNALLNFIFPPLLLLLAIWQLVNCLVIGRKADRPEAIIGWISLGVTSVAMIASWAGYIFLALLILVWWYFQLAAILSITAVWHFLVWYKEHRLTHLVQEYRSRITYVSGPDKEKLLFGATWFHDLIQSVIIPILTFLSIPLCVRLSLNVFEFSDLYDYIFKTPFIHLSDKAGADTFHISLYSLLLLAGLLFIFRYADKALHTIWQSTRYRMFMLKYKRKSIRNNEVNLSLGNSIISVVIWFTYIVVVIVTLQIPTGSLGLIAGGLSAGIGIALKDILNNFIYGIQLMGGRLRVGDWIECDGIRGRVTDINYQSTLVVTENATQVAFLNAALFNKNFTNLTRNNSYEFTKIVVGISYGTDVQRVREVLESAMEVMKTKDSYGQDVVDPAYGIFVRFSDFNNSSVDVAVKQYVLVSERIAYVDKAKEVIYNALNQAGITIPFPQCDVHMIKDED